MHTTKYSTLADWRCSTCKSCCSLHIHNEQLLRNSQLSDSFSHPLHVAPVPLQFATINTTITVCHTINTTITVCHTINTTITVCHTINTTITVCHTMNTIANSPGGSGVDHKIKLLASTKRGKQQLCLINPGQQTFPSSLDCKCSSVTRTAKNSKVTRTSNDLSNQDITVPSRCPGQMLLGSKARKHSQTCQQMDQSNQGFKHSQVTSATIALKKPGHWTSLGNWESNCSQTNCLY